MGMHTGRGIVALTGATGFLGSHIADALLAGGWSVRASVRPTSSLRWLAGKPVQTLVVDLTDPRDCARLLAGTAGLIHCAGVVAALDEAGFRHGNVATTAALLEAAAATWTEPLPDPAPAFVLVSSLAAHGPAPLERPAVETDPSAPVTAYGRSKREAERLVATAPGLFRRAVLRPPSLYGPRDRDFLPLLRLAHRGWTLRLGRRLGGMSLVDGRDAAAAAVALLATPAAEGVFFVDDGQRGYDFPALARALGEAVGRPVRLATVPLGPLRLWARLLPGASPLLTPDRIRDLEQAGWVCDGSRLAAVTGFAAQRRATRGFAETMAFNREAGWQ
ncbi:MAG: NAD-dependent epimerase/dehydratase family protein [Krumholzibacteria bacterium]|nr:NAD-dependent epimerase/dehydratase family protein [Candidatus Krumholzibacteria bacterium]